MFDANGVICTNIHKVTISLLSPRDIKKYSVCKVDSPIVFDDVGPRKNGLHDPAMGSIDNQVPCTTCGCRRDCSGHIGHIEFPFHLFHPTLLPACVKLLKGFCFYCCRLRIQPQVAQIFVKKFQFIQLGLLSELEKYEKCISSHSSAGESSTQKLDCSAKKAQLMEILKSLQKARKLKLKESNLSADISQNRSVIELWSLLRNSFFKASASKSSCYHCGKPFQTTVKRAATNISIELTWPDSIESPFKNSDSLNFGDRILRRGRGFRKVNLLAFELCPLLQKLWKSPDAPLLQFLFPISSNLGWEIFFMQYLPVPANRFRPLIKIGSNDRGGLHPHTAVMVSMLEIIDKLYFTLSLMRYPLDTIKSIQSVADLQKLNLPNIPELKANEFLKLKDVIMEHSTNRKKIYEYAEDLQGCLNGYIDSTISPNKTGVPPGIRQWIERKQGAIRQKMMGKRVNFSARTVIAPDNLINTNEIGVPIEFAMALSLPEYVTHANLNYLKNLIENGPNKYPGANMLELSDGSLYDLRVMTHEQRSIRANLLENVLTEHKGNAAIVHRHVQDGDIVLMNRQPTLHRASMMAHYVKILQGWKTFRLMYVNCSSYNADFDGDEMNLHLPQDLYSRSEAQALMDADTQYITCKNAEPIRGLIQDHVLGGVFLTNRGTFLTADEYYNLLYVGMCGFIDQNNLIHLSKKTKSMRLASTSYSRLLKDNVWNICVEPPTIIKPQKLWTGKQVITSIIRTIVDNIALQMYDSVAFKKRYKGINYTSKSKTPGDAWGGVFDNDSEESTIIIKESELLQGVFDKSMFGASAYGFVHICYEYFGAPTAGLLLSVFAKTFSCYLQMRGFSCSLGDFMMTPKGEAKRLEIIKKSIYAGTYLQELFLKSIDFQSNNETLGLSSQTIDKVKLEQLQHFLDFKVKTNTSTLKSQEIDFFGLQIPSKTFKRLEESLNLEKDWSDARSSNVLVAIHSDWTELQNMKPVSKALHSLYKILKQMAFANNVSQKIVIENLLKVPGLSLYFPRLSRMLKLPYAYDPYNLKLLTCEPSVNSTHNDTEFSHHDDKSKIFNIDTENFDHQSLPKPNKITILPDHTCLYGPSHYRSPILYDPSWVYDADSSLPFNSTLKYSENLLNIKSNHLKFDKTESSNQTNLFCLRPNNITRTRFKQFSSSFISNSSSLSAYSELLSSFDKYFLAGIRKLSSLQASSASANLLSKESLLYTFPNNGFISMLLTGAKGSFVNFSMICYMLSQQSLEGSRVPNMISWKTLPCFGSYDFGARSKGFIYNRYLDGLSAPEFFFHCMAGREGLVDTAVKTSRSGYLQRSVIKNLESVIVNYDNTVRDSSDNNIIQFLYGEDGIDICKAAYINRNFELLQNPLIVKAKYFKKYESKRVVNSIGLIKNYENATYKNSSADRLSLNFSNQQLSDKDVCTDLYPPMLYPGSVSEAFYTEIQNTLKKAKKKNVLQEFNNSRDYLENLLRLKFTEMQCCPGESVGCICAQSIGEPATQMTLNTFHLAGHGATNVTLGIPRLREILQTAGQTKTPLLAVPIKPAGDMTAKYTERILQSLKSITLADVINGVGVESNVYIQLNTHSGLQEINVSKDLELPQFFWEYEIVVQFENLTHFCQVYPSLKPQNIISLTVNKVIFELAKIIKKYVILYSAKYAEELVDDDELELLANRFMFEKDVKNYFARKEKRKEQAQMAGTGFGGKQKNIDDEFENMFDKAEEINADILKKKIKAKLNKKSEEDSDQETANSSDSSSLTSEEDRKEVEEEEDNDDEKERSTNLAEEKQDDSEDNKNNEDEEEDLLYKMKAEISDSDTEMDTTVLDHSQPIKFTYEYDSKLRMVQSQHNLDNVNAPHEAFINAEIKHYKLKKLPQEVFRYLTHLTVCRKTWTLKAKFGWPYRRCPKQINLLDSTVKIIEKCVIYNIPGIKKPRIVTGENTETKSPFELQCEGSNFQAIFQLSNNIVDHTRLYSNDIRAVLQYYGIEACCTVIIRELNKVFGVYGITVDRRHLSLIADAMTQTGSFQPFSRLGMRYHNSPFLQMSFETSMKFLTDAVERQAEDNLKSPAGAIVTGKSPLVGSGLCEILSCLNVDEENATDI